jgi:N-acetylglucosamine kinase-like BadF-type ATPase
MNRDGNRITAILRTYDKGFNWKPLAEELVATVRQNWRGAVQVDWPESIPASEKKALPDSVESCD